MDLHIVQKLETFRHRVDNGMSSKGLINLDNIFLIEFFMCLVERQPFQPRH